ncbi:hypothetical protein Barb7_00460 [Bacteroidales bacterium Barb7]|nr:hypothetical protein Barb7_00460 [Bacteroidales bacterium Barb7]
MINKHKSVNMGSFTRKTKMVLFVFTSVFLCACTTFIYPIIKYANYEKGEKEKMSDKFYMEFPMSINAYNYFLIPCKINSNHSVNLIVDTKAVSLMKEEQINAYNGKYWGKLPLNSKNAYGNSFAISLYKFDSFEINTYPFGSYLFQKIDRDNIIYDMIGDGVLGSNILSAAYWKFSIDENLVKVFSKNDSAAITKETAGFQKIENGLTDNGVDLCIQSLDKRHKFTLDLGFSGEIEIDNKLFNSMKKHYPYTTINRLRKDLETSTVNIFENITLSLDTFIITNCQLVNITDVNGNYIGAEFMRKFNFILMYNERKNHIKQNHLYIKPVHTIDSKKSDPYISKFGFDIGRRRDKTMIISLIENGTEESFLQLGDEILDVDNGAFDLSTENMTKNFISYSIKKDSVSLRTKDKGVLILKK